MLCAISGVVPEEPVVSLKSGHVFEKRLIEKHLKAVGTCPETKEELTMKDLIAVKGNKAVRPRAPNASSIPGMMNVFQNEWDALMLETYTLKQHLDSTRQQLAHTLYQHDAACRVIARLMKERDAARAALGDSSANAASSAMDTEDDNGGEGAGITGKVLEVMQSTAAQLTKGRKKRIKALAAKVTAAADPSKYKQLSSNSLHSASKAGLTCLDLNPKNQDLVITGGNDNNAIVFDRSTGKIADTLKGHKKKITDVKFHASGDVAFTTSEDKTATIWRKDGKKFGAAHTLKKHTGAVTGCTLHPSGSYLVTASADKSWSFFDVETGACREQVKGSAGYTSVQFHPDGLILGAAAEDNVVRIFDVKQRKNVATFTGHNSSLTGLSFSQNGYYLATAEEAGIVKLWDLRKLTLFHSIKSDDIPIVNTVEFDESGSFLAVGGEDLRVFSSKGWGEVACYKDHKDAVTGVRFGNNASFIASTGGAKDRQLKFFGL